MGQIIFHVSEKLVTWTESFPFFYFSNNLDKFPKR